MHKLRHSGAVSEYHVSGCDKLGEREWHFILLVGLSSHLPEACLWRVLADARVPQQLSSIRSDIEAEYQHLETVDASVWALLGQASGISQQELRSSVLGAALVSWSFLDWRVLQPASSLPWRLLQGDVWENLRLLEHDDSLCCDGVSEKLQHLLRLQVSKSVIDKAMRLLGECVWTTSLTEKQHTGVAATKRFHSELTQNVLAARAYMHVTRQMLPGRTVEQRQLERWEHRWQKLQQARPNRISGRHMFMKQAMEKAAYMEQHRRMSGQYDRTKIVRVHAGIGGLLPGLSKKSMSVWQW